LRRVSRRGGRALELVLVGFTFNIIRSQRLPELWLPPPKHNFRALPDPYPRNAKTLNQAAHNRAQTSEIPFNSGEGCAGILRAGRSGHYASFKQHVHQIDLPFPQWCMLCRRRER